MTSKSYLESLNNSLKELNASNTRIAAKRKFMNIYEDPSAGLKAMQVRKNLSRVGVYKENLTEALGILDQYEAAIANINDITTEALVKLSQGMTGTSGEAERKVIADTLRGFQRTILSAANTRYAGDYIFGGSGTGTIPFTTDSSGKLLYKGQDVDTGSFAEEIRLIDIGIGLTKDASGDIIPSSAFNIANSGVSLLGSGIDANGVPENLYSLLGKIADTLESGNFDNMEMYRSKLEQKSNDIRLQYVSVGEKSNFISYFMDRLETEKMHSVTRQNELESINYEKSIIEFNELQLAYNACLQIGTKLLQPSLLDFLR